MEKPMNRNYRAFIAKQSGDDVICEVVQRTLEDLPADDVTILVSWSSINYKDGLASLAKGGVVRDYPRVLGIDLAGIVVNSTDPRYAEGDEVLITGFNAGVGHDGGYATYARVPGDWIVKCPEALSLREAMIFGTAGFTAALAIRRLEHLGLTSTTGPVLVTGATGGVGSMAVSMLNNLGYEVHASTGKKNEHDYLKAIGANIVLDRNDVNSKGRPLDKELWAGAIDQVGGTTLSWIMSTLMYRGAVACTGLTGGFTYSATVLPLLLRGASVLGVDSVMCPANERPALWERMSGELKPNRLDDLITTEIDLDGVADALTKILAGKNRGRTIVKIG